MDPQRPYAKKSGALVILLMLLPYFLQEAEIICHVSKAETISYAESVLLGDPFDFLADWDQRQNTFFRWLNKLERLLLKNYSVLVCKSRSLPSVKL